jgi:hypothetical protein
MLGSKNTNKYSGKFKMTTGVQSAKTKSEYLDRS